jgi:hypothetical protein
MALPVTFVPGDVLEANQLNSNFDSVYATYTDYTPTLTGWTLGNGTFSTKYATVGDMVHYYGFFTFGSTSAVTGTNIQVSLPVTGALLTKNDTAGLVIWNDISAGVTVMGTCIQQYNNNLPLFWFDPETAPLAVRAETWTSGGATLPFTFATGDYIYWSITYAKA